MNRHGGKNEKKTRLITEIIQVQKIKTDMKWRNCHQFGKSNNTRLNIDIIIKS